MLIPNIISHPKGKIVDETAIFLSDKDKESKGSSFFTELIDENLA